MTETIEPKDVVVVKLAAMACLQLGGRTKRQLDEFAAETQTEVQPIETAMEAMNRLSVGGTTPFTTTRTDDEYVVEYTANKDNGHLVCAALISRLFALLHMPLDGDEQQWEGGRALTTEEKARIRELAASIRIDPPRPAIH